jgi:cytochrome c-type biogenesis protein CcmH
MDISNMLTQLLERLKQNPEDSQGWFMLGRTYKYLKEYDKAVDAFAEAYRLQGDNIDLILQYADALIMSRNGRMDGKPSELVFKALSINPENTTGLWLAGMIKAEQGEFSAALEYWVKLEPLIENDAKSTIELQRLIVEARAKIGQQAPVVKSEQTQSLTTAPQAAATITPALTVRVQLSVDLQNQATSTDTVFIYAQALQGMRMPLAILRKQVKDLPITVTLTDAESMTPMAKLSGHEQVKILARISKAGSAMPQTGDLLGTVAPVQVAQTETIQLVISQVLD